MLDSLQVKLFKLESGIKTPSISHFLIFHTVHGVVSRGHQLVLATLKVPAVYPIVIFEAVGEAVFGWGIESCLGVLLRSFPITGGFFGGCFYICPRS